LLHRRPGRSLARRDFAALLHLLVIHHARLLGSGGLQLGCD
jgi:hypothetical protein